MASTNVVQGFMNFLPNNPSKNEATKKMFLGRIKIAQRKNLIKFFTTMMKTATLKNKKFTFCTCYILKK